jgi:CRP-like cAMP-binding protein/uncharacterized protein (DUF2225 family)
MLELNEKVLESFSKSGTIESFSENQMLFMENDAGANMYIALDGLFGVYINSFTDFPVKVAEIKPGAFFGEMSVLDGSPRSATIVSETVSSSALVVEKGKFSLLLLTNPQITQQIFDTLINRITITFEELKKSNKTPPELPHDLKSLKNKEDGTARDNLNIVTALSKHLRTLNEMLTSAPNAPSTTEAHEAIAEPEKEAAPLPEKDVVRLLPDSYPNFTQKIEEDLFSVLQFKDMACSYCGNEVGAYIPMFSALKQKETTIDQRVIYEKFDILWHMNVVCPNCNYTDTYQEFTKSEKMNSPKYNGNQFPNKENFTKYSHAMHRDLSEVVLSYHQNIHCLESLGKADTNPIRLGKAWLRLHWLFSDIGEIDLAKNAAQMSKEYYKKFLEISELNMSNEDFMHTNAILGKLHTEIGEYSSAQEYFKKNVDIGSVAGGTPEFVRECLRRYQELKELM